MENESTLKSHFNETRNLKWLLINLSHVKQLLFIKKKLTSQYEAIETGLINLQDVAERIRELAGEANCPIPVLLKTLEVDSFFDLTLSRAIDVREKMKEKIIAKKTKGKK